MRTIRQTRLAAGPKGVIPIGRVYQCADDVAQALVDAGAAEYVAIPAPKPAPEPIAEPEPEPEPETKAAAKPRRKRKA